MNTKQTPSQKSMNVGLIWAVALAGLVAVGFGLQSSGMLSNFSQNNGQEYGYGSTPTLTVAENYGYGPLLTPVTSANWITTYGNPYEKDVSKHLAALEWLYRIILKKGEAMPEATAVKFYGNLSTGLAKLLNNPVYAQDYEVRSIVKYLVFELGRSRDVLKMKISGPYWNSESSMYLQNLSSIIITARSEDIVVKSLVKYIQQFSSDPDVLGAVVISKMIEPELAARAFAEAGYPDINEDMIVDYLNQHHQRYKTDAEGKFAKAGFKIDDIDLAAYQFTFGDVNQFVFKSSARTNEVSTTPTLQ